MIVRPHLHWFRLLFVWRGSVLPYIATRLLLVLTVSIASVLSLDWWMSAHAASALSIPDPRDKRILTAWSLSLMGALAMLIYLCSAYPDSYGKVAALLPEGITPTDGYVRTLPGMLADKGGLDGFFIACFTRAQ